MPNPTPGHATLDDWVARKGIAFSPDSAESVDAAVDGMVGSLGDSVALLGLGEPMHGAREFLVLRNRIFQRLVAAHGYSAIAAESSFPRSRLVDDYVAGGGAGSYEAVRDAGFSHGFGRAEGNRELVEWMRGYNADRSHGDKLRFYGFDSPTEMTGTDSPRQLLRFALDYLDSAGSARARESSRRIEELLGSDAQWEDPAAMMDPTKSVGLSPAAAALRIETEDLITELTLRRPELATADDDGRYREALQHAVGARQLLNYHGELARASDDRIARLLGIRDATMADNLAYAVDRERGRGKVLAFAHNSHLQRGRATWQLGPHALSWWPAGAHAHEMLGPRYAVIGVGVAASEPHGIGPPEPGTLEARLAPSGCASGTGAARYVPTHRGQGLSLAAMAELPTRKPSATNPGYFPFTAQSVTDFDALIVIA